MLKAGSDGVEYIDQAKMKNFKWNDPKSIEALGQTDMILSPEDRIFGKKRLILQKSSTC